VAPQAAEMQAGSRWRRPKCAKTRRTITEVQLIARIYFSKFCFSSSMCSICVRFWTWRLKFHASQGTNIELGVLFPSKRHFGRSVNGRDDEVLFFESKDLTQYGYPVFNSRYFAGVFKPCFAYCHCR